MTRQEIPVDDLHIETDSLGFVLGVSLLGDNLTDDTTVWADIKADFTSLKMSRSVAVERGVLFRPEASVLTLRTSRNSYEDYKSGILGRRIRVRYKDTLLFIGTVKSAGLQSEAEHEDTRTIINIKALGMIQTLTNVVLSGYGPVEETTGERIESLIGGLSNFSVTVNNCERLVAARATTNISLMTVLQECTDAQIARVYVDRNNVLVVDGDAAPEPTLTFSDVGTGLNYQAIDMSEDEANTITAVIAETTADESITASASHPQAVITHQERYQVNLPADQSQIDAWVESFPLRGYTRLEPSGMETHWQDGMEDIELLHLVNVRWKGEEFRAGIKEISHAIKPDRNGNLIWDVDLELMPGHLLEFTSFLTPSEPTRFQAVATGAHTIQLSWKRPDMVSDMTGYEIRVNEGSDQAPEKETGSLVDVVDDSITSFEHTGLESNLSYAYSIFAVSGSPSVYSNRATAVVSTPQDVSSAPQNLVATKNATTQHTLTWDEPLTPGADTIEYVIRYRLDVDDDPFGTTTFNPTPYSGVEVAVIPIADTSYVATGLPRNENVRWGIFPRTIEGDYAAGAFAVANTNEVIPGGVTGLSATAPAFNQVSVSWGAASSLTDFDHYRVEYRVGTAPAAPGGGILAVNTTSLSATINGLSGSKTYGIAVWPVTVGGKFGTRRTDSVTTPAGPVNRVYEADCAWSQSYKEAGGYSGSYGATRDMYYGQEDIGNGIQRSMVGWAVPSNVTNCYSVDRVILRIYNKRTTFNSGADCWFGVHTGSTKPSTFTQTAGGLGIYRLPKTGWVELDITAWAKQHLKSGAKGFTLGPPPSNDPVYFGLAAGVNGPKPNLRIEYRTLT